ncbi:MAG TPA: hypothetical protein VIK62_07430 [Verrucomicrobiae bacterium]
MPAIYWASAPLVRLKDCLKNPERGCAVLDQPQQVPIFQPKTARTVLRLVCDTPALLFSDSL